MPDRDAPYDVEGAGVDLVADLEAALGYSARRRTADQRLPFLPMPLASPLPHGMRDGIRAVPWLAGAPLATGRGTNLVHHDREPADERQRLLAVKGESG